MMELNLDRFYPYPVPRVWQVVTQRVERWLPARGFRPVKGCVFIVQGPEAPGYDGRAACTVLEVDPPRRLSFSWRGGPVDSVVTLELVPEHEGTRVRLRQTGLPGERLSAKGMPLAWDLWLEAMNGPLGRPNVGFGPVVLGAVFAGVSMMAVVSVAVLVVPLAGRTSTLPPGIPQLAPPGEGNRQPPSAVRCDENLDGGPVLAGGLTGEVRCGETIAGVTRGGILRFDSAFYRDARCQPAGPWDGGDERVYRLSVPADTLVTVTLDTPCADLDLAAMRVAEPRIPETAADVDQCEMRPRHGRTSEALDLLTADGASWYLVIEGKAKEEGAFSLTVQCEASGLPEDEVLVVNRPEITRFQGGGSAEAKVGGGDVKSDGQGDAETPLFSADGRYLAFEVSYDEESSRMFYALLNGSVVGESVFAIGPDLGRVANPTWHPAQPIFIFEGAHLGRSRLYLQQPGGQSASEFITDRSLGGALSFPTFSADGQALAFVSSVTGGGDIYARSSRNGEIRRLSRSAKSEVSPRFSRGGKNIAFTRRGASDDIVELDLASGEERLVIAGKGDQVRPIYAANDTIVYFTNARAGRWDLAVLDATGKHVLAQDVRLPTRAPPAISPDGRWVAWTHADPVSTTVQLTRIDGSKTIEVTTPFVAPGEPTLGVRTMPDARNMVLLAYTYLPDAGATSRHLGLMDITGAMP